MIILTGNVANFMSNSPDDFTKPIHLNQFLSLRRSARTSPLGSKSPLVPRTSSKHSLLTNAEVAWEPTAPQVL